MSVHPVATAFPNGATSYDTIQQQLAAGFPLVLVNADDIEAMDFSATGAVVVPEVVIVRATGLIYTRDPSSSDSHNGVTVLVSDDGKRFVAPLAPQAFVNVIDRTNTPPGSPSAGDRYIVGPAPSGDWASNADDLTFYDGAGWVFVSPVIGQSVYVRAVASRGDWQWGEAGDWESKTAQQAGSVTPSMMSLPWGVTVVSETATPPGGTPAAGTFYIVGIGATGDWADEDGNLAEADGAGGWTFYTPYDGARVFDAAAAYDKRYVSATGLWVSAAGAWIGHDYVSTPGNGSQTAPTGTSTTQLYEYSTSSGPNTDKRRRIDDETLSYAAKVAGTLLRFSYTFSHDGYSYTDINAYTNAMQPVVAALFRDSETTAIAWARLTASDYNNSSSDTTPLPDLSRYFHVVFPPLAAADADPHTYKVAIISGAFNLSSTDKAKDCGVLTQRLFEVQERVP